MVVVDDGGAFYAFDAALLDERRRRPAGGGADYHDLSGEEVAAARLSDESRAAVQLALGYERVGTACGPVPAAAELIVGADPPTVFAVLGSIGAG